MKKLLKTNTMRRFSVLLFFAGLFFLASAMRNGGVEIASLNGYEICSGHGQENMALIEIISAPPLNVSSDVRLEYIWTVRHEMGNRVWHTTFPERRVPIPWMGTYTIKATVLYFTNNKSRPFAAFPSNTIRIVGVDCEGRR